MPARRSIRSTRESFYAFSTTGWALGTFCRPYLRRREWRRFEGGSTPDGIFVLSRAMRASEARVKAESAHYLQTLRPWTPLLERDTLKLLPEERSRRRNQGHLQAAGRSSSG